MRPCFRTMLFFFILLIGSSQTSDTLTGVRLLHQAEQCLDSAKYEAALHFGQQAYSNFASNDVRAAACLLLLGKVFLEMGDFDAAYSQFYFALEIFSKNGGAKSALAAQALNNLGECFYKRSNYAQAEIYYRKALRMRQALFGETHEAVADAYNNLGNCLIPKGLYADARMFHEKALAIRQQVLPADHADLASSYNNLGNCFYLGGDYTQALPLLEQALRMRRTTLGIEHPKTAQVLNNLGNCFAALGQRSLAAQYYRQALEIRRRYFGPQHPDIATASENLGDLYFENGDYFAALDLFREVFLSRQQMQGDSAAATAALRHKIGLCYQYEGDYDKALTQHLSAATVLTKVYGANHPFVGGLYNNLGNCYAAKRDFAHALEFYQRAEGIFKQILWQENIDLVLVYNNIGLCFLEQKQPVAALSYFKKAEKTLRQTASAAPGLAICLKNQGLAFEQMGREPEALAAFAKALANPATTDPIDLIEVRSAQGTLLCQRGIRHHDLASLQQSAAVLDEALRCADSLRLQLTAAASRQRWLEKQYPVQASAVEAYFQLWQITGEERFLERSFALAERSKSLQLLESLHHEQAERFAGIPDSLLAKERYWGEEINLREKNRLTWLNAGAVAETKAAEVAVAEARQVLASLVEDFEIQYPDYYRLKHTVQTASLSAVRTELLGSEARAWVEYFSTDSAIFVFVITQQHFKGLRLARDFPLGEWVATLRSSIQAYPTASGSAAAELSAAYTQAAYQIYQKVVAPLRTALSLPPRLILVPDGVLAYLPFEALLSEQPADCQKFKSHRYLLQDFRISYAYSATQLFGVLQAPRRQFSKTLLAFAPDFKNNPYGLQTLQHTCEEAQAACRLLGGDLRDGDQATAASFLSLAGDYQILLLATHGQASAAVGDLSFLAFSPPADSADPAFLYVRDLYLQSLPAEMVVLSACETNIGEYRLGEGIISLAKGFFHAGARSIVATLWSVDDAKNAGLMRLFFKNIKAGQSKDEALQQAKRTFIEKHPHDEAHPVFWAAAVASGDMQALRTPGSGWSWPLGALLAIIGLLWMVKKFWKKRLKIVVMVRSSWRWQGR